MRGNQLTWMIGRCLAFAVVGLAILDHADLGPGSTAAFAQSRDDRVVLPPAPIPSARIPSARTRQEPRSAFNAPNPVPRPTPDTASVEDTDGLPPAAIATPAPAASRELVEADAFPPIPVPRETLIVQPGNPENLEDAGNRQRHAETQPAEEPADDFAATQFDLACHAALETAGGLFEPIGTVEGEGQCGIEDAVSLRAINGIALQPAALLACPTAATFTAFVEQVIAPQAENILGSDPTRLYVAASFACRGRNNVAGARLSEHSFGRAVDIRALDLEDGQSWHVRPHEEGSEEPAAQFQAVLREEGCGPFNTVLGPGSDGHHTDHIHFDNARRSSTYCR